MKVLWADFEVYLFGIGRRFDPASADENKITHARELNFTEQSSADYMGGGGVKTQKKENIGGRKYKYGQDLVLQASMRKEQCQII